MVLPGFGVTIGSTDAEVERLLRARGVLRTEYTGSTLRDHLSQRVQ
jgi:hypothetical protein